MTSNTSKSKIGYQPPYGDLTEINNCRLVLDSIGKDALNHIVGDYIDILGTSAAVYEKNGDYALGIFTSGWCQFLDKISRELCGTSDNAQALKSGKWLCHESCWTEASKQAIETKQPVDIECCGGIRLFAVPIFAGAEVVGAMNFGYGTPPKKQEKLQEIANKFGVSVDKLIVQAKSYKPRSSLIIEICKKQLLSAARLVGSAIQSKQAEEALRSREAWFSTTLRSIGDAVIATDEKAHVKLINSVAQALTGWNDKDALGEPLGDVFNIVNEETGKQAENPVDKVIREGVVVGLANHTALIAKDGTRCSIDDSGAPIKDEKGNVIGVILVFRDVTEQRKLEHNLNERLKELSCLYGIASITERPGITIDEIYQQTVELLPQNWQRPEVAYAQLIIGDKEFKTANYRETRWRQTADIKVHGIKAGTVGVGYLKERPASDEGPFLEEEGQLINAVAERLGRITEHKQAEAALIESEIKYKGLAENLNELIYRCNPKTFVATYVNKSIERLYGYTAEEWLKDPTLWESAIHPDDKERVLAELAKANTIGEPYAHEYRILRKDKEVRWVEDHLAWGKDQQGNPVSINGVMYDITEHRKAEEALRESEERYRTLFESAAEGILIADIEDKKIKYANAAICKMLGYSHEELTKMGVDDIHPKTSLEHIVAEFDAQSMATRTLSSLPCLKKDGTIIQVNINGVKAVINGRECNIGFFTDITERKQAAEDLADSEARYRRLFETAQDSILILDGDTGQIIDANPFVKDLLGYSMEELVGKNLWEIGDLKDTLASKISNEQLQRTGYVRYDHLPLVTKDGRNIAIEMVANSYQVDHTKVIQCNIRDITDRKHMEEEQQRSAKLESVGTLAGGIAHDFNNILTGILGNIQLAGGYLKENKADTAQEMLAEAEKESLRAKNLTQQLLTFSKGGAPVKKVILIDNLIKESITFALRGSNVKPEFAMPDDLWAVEADEGQINQVINNIVINANQAMPNGGMINIKASNVVVKEKQILPLPEGNYVEIDIIDHGTGIPKSHVNRIFEPYFTTKGKGNGLGLASSYSIIKNHGGTITFESELEVGTVFHIYLPVTKEKVEEAKKEEASAATQLLSSDQGRILVMDDEETVLKLLSRMLKGVGYEVELTRDGAEAIERYTKAKESGQPFDAVIMDLTIPGGMGGKETIEKLLEIDLDVKAIVSSGYATDPIMADYKKYGFSGVVTKPYDLGQMQETLHDVLICKSTAS
ncbi:PAS domain S-box protein [Chloroflexota bacterium]